ncbi:Uncharacterised protein [Acinetobacter baumannii]|uniref:ABC-three component system middle component 1 n=1 Tax=Acinetobacter baumannii TaxID=470 RepID=UPI000DA65607|nr:ABC-three component system middle component 1 [Acinetobacter baumannii]MCQ1056302.1 hypothetical protein [Acinetobacter baumannii]SSS38500.1 Uncharacterised protein [Acinetobacter baumannii]
MITIINKILSSNGYQVVDIELLDNNPNIFLFSPSSNDNKEEYFVTIQLPTQSNESAKELLEHKAEELFEAISDSDKVERYFIKNCTMLICHNETFIHKETIFSIEEDPYNFKKNVITYSETELNDLKDFLTSNNINEISNSVISDIINNRNGQNFTDFKNTHKTIRNYYSLFLKIALKLPFIMYTPSKKELINLSLEIENSFNAQDSLIYKKIMESDIEWSESDTYLQVVKIWGNLT